MLAHRWQYLSGELHTIDKMLRQLYKESASTLLEQFSIEPCVATTLLVTAGDNPQRLGKESAFVGLTPKLNESGSFKGRTTLRKIGPSRIRSKIFLAAVSAGQYNPDIKAQKIGY
ncbi:transposase [Vibrio splendidus]|uniref:transposase n=1 Tax=Vibrio splendidus TaxID=29497 RepID=UPI0015E677EF|nr:transposase [Vibrio splendidus]